MNFFLLILVFMTPLQLCEKLKSFQVLAPHLEKSQAEKIFNEILDEGIYSLRGPKEDGTFEYAYLSEENPLALNFSFDIEKTPFLWKQKGENIFSIKITVPRKKNLFWGNEDAYLKEALIKIDGIEKILERERILKRGENYEYPLKKIYKEFEIILTFEKLEGKERSSYVEVYLYQAGLKDSIKNPHYDLLMALMELKKAGFYSSSFEEKLGKTLLNCGSPIKRELDYILYLLKGTSKEQREGIERLEKITKQIP